MLKKINFTNLLYILVSILFLLSAFFDLKIISIEYINNYFGFFDYLPYIFSFGLIISIFAFRNKKIVDLFGKNVMPYLEDIELIFPCVFVTLLSYVILSATKMLPSGISWNSGAYIFMFWFFLLKSHIFTNRIYKRADVLKK